jgi:molecular chaperone HscB
LYQISQDVLKKQYREKMKQLHPDKHTLKPEKEQEEAAKHASNMTRAYETIKDNYDRALHLLKLEGYPIGENFSVSILYV